MKKLYALEVHSTAKTKNRLPKNPLQPYKTYWRYIGPRRPVKRLERKMKEEGWNTLVYDADYARSDTYRQDFFQANKSRDGIYRCVYCGKRLRKFEVNVDHIVPVGAVKRSRKARRLLRGRGVNDLSNLAVSCQECNLAKGASAGRRWKIRAHIGKRIPWIYTVLRIVKIMLLLSLLTAVVLSVLYPEEALRVLETFWKWLSESFGQFIR